MGIRACFREEHIFGIEDVLPDAKPSLEGFRQVMERVGAKPETSVMFEVSSF